MSTSAACLSPTEAARQLGVSAKALRLYEEHGLLSPGRTQAGWRTYGPEEMARAREIVAMRALGLSLAQIGAVFAGGPAENLAAVLAAHEASLDHRLRADAAAIARVRELRSRIDAGARPSAADLTALANQQPEIAATMDLPWPWGGERFELRALKPLTYLSGPLFSGKTKLAMAISEAIPGAIFIGLDRAAIASLSAAPDDVQRTITWLIEDGATLSDALAAIATALEANGPSAVVFDLIEQGLDEASQLALAAHLRRRGRGATPVVAMTRSTAMLDLVLAGPDEDILFCPANHSPPFYVSPHPGAAGFEALSSCLASPDVRVRTEGVIAIRQPAA